MQNGPSSSSPQTDAQAIKIMKTIWFALLVSQFVLAFVAFKILTPAESESHSINEQIFLGMGLMALAASFVVPQILNKSLVVSADQISVSTLFTPFIISLALNEACTIMGFMVKRITNNDQISMALFAISGIVYLCRFPVENKIKNQVEILKNQKTK